MEYLFTFQNTHYAIHSEKILKKAHLPVYVMSLPSKLGDYCGICLRVEPEHFLEGKSLLEQQNIPIEKVFTIEQINGERIYKPWKN